MSRSRSRSDADDPRSAPNPEQLSLFGGEKSRTPTVAEVQSPSPRVVRTKDDTTAKVESPQDRLRKRLQQHLPDETIHSVTLTRNRTRIVSARPRHSPSGESDGLDLRIHRCFADADEHVVQSVARFFAAKTREARAEPLQVIRDHFSRFGQEDRTRTPKLKPKGKHFDLVKLRDRVNQDYFEGRLRLDITWGRGAAKKRPRRRRKGSFSIRLGSYDDRTKLIRIHPVLDRPEVPEFVIESIIYHEMLHAVIPPRPGKTRRSVHPPEFRRMERLYERFEEAEAWIEANVERLSRLR